MEPDYQNLRLSVDPRGVATITLHRPDKHNALDDRLIAELREAARQVDGDDRIRVAVLTGAGTSFCAGGDIGWFSRNLSLTRAQRIQQSAELAGMLRDLDQLSKPLIGRINGAAFGGGVGMISVCDIAVGVEQARFALTEVRLGLLPANISPYVVARMGAANCRATMLSGESFDARRAVSMGLLNEVVPDGVLDQRMDRLVAQHLQGAPGAVAATKRLIREVAGRAVEDSMALTAERLADAWESPEGRIGVESFLNRTCPPWRSES